MAWILVSKDITSVQTQIIQVKSGASMGVVAQDLSEKKLNLKNNYKLLDLFFLLYDYLFTKGIKGLITKFGGVNSHMSIRCSELSIPAAIGIGEKNFSKINKAKLIRLDCKHEKLELVR